MKKNKKNKNEKVILNHEELMPTTIGVLDEKDNGVLGVVLIIGLFLVCIFLLPYITEWYKDFTSKPEVTVAPNNNKTNTTDNDEQNTEVTYSKIDNNLNITVDDYKFTGFTVSNNKISFKVTPNSKDSNYFTNHNYYFELFDESKKMLQRIKFSNTAITKDMTYTYDINASYSKDVYYLTFREITDDMIPNVTLSNNTLICTKGNDEIAYTFINKDKQNILNKIKITTKVLDTVSDYESILNKYTKLVDSTKSVEGISTTLTPTLNGFNYEANINLDEASTSDIIRLFNGDYIYSKDSVAKVISFELSSLNYNCK